MGEWNPLKIDDFTWDVLKVYIKHGYGDYKLYNTTFLVVNYQTKQFV